ncbi:collagen alpha-3(VI) chain isoform X2 [Stegostoma tigrinum]|uniref:collagen alpha-3(VI) chain isoform X2 n=1 Tax=Stegostoma tigrinum TaxID=3053191 RepID=UPI002870A75B|nr:collagen alpha-3(VI) chain isoform X2 [Stegostoma tigrinum]
MRTHSVHDTDSSNLQALPQLWCNQWFDPTTKMYRTMPPLAIFGLILSFFVGDSLQQAKKRDIVFLIDGSPGMGRSFLHVRNFLNNIIQELDIGPDRDQVAVVQYSSNPRLEFGLNTHSTRDAVLNTIKKLRLKTGRPLNTGAALDYVTRNVFSPSAGSRGDAGASQILVLITAGKSFDDVGRAADTMKQAGIVPIAIGAKDADATELQQIVSNPESVLKLGDFHELKTIQQELLSKVRAMIVVDEPIPPTEVSASRKRDIVFLIDGSPGMGRSFIQVREFLNNIIQELDIGPDRDQVAVVQYSSNPRLEFGLNTHSTRDAVLNTIKRMRLKTGRPLNTGAALDYVTRNVFNPSAGSRAGIGALQILVLITAGKSFDNVGGAADTMKQAGIVPIAIGAKKAVTAELQQIVSNPDSVLKLGEFNELQNIQEEFLTKVTAVSVVEEPIPPTEVVRREMSERDIVFLIDGSDNVGNTNLPFVKDFITRIVRNLAIGSDQVRVGLAQYSDDIEAEFYLNTYSSEAELLSHIRTIILRGGTTVNTGSALDFASKYFFSRAAGSRIKENIPQFLVLITSGRSDDDVEASSDALKRAAVMTFAVGVKHTDPAELEEMAIDPSLIFGVNDFQSLPDLLDEMIIPLTTLAVPTIIIEEPTIKPMEPIPATKASPIMKRDIVFLIGGSPVMGRSFLHVREFLSHIIQELDIGPDRDQVAVVQYSVTARLEFGLNTHSTKSEMLDAVKKLRLKTGRPLNAGAALDYVTRNVFSPSAGSRGDAGASQILVLITAGKSRDDVGRAADTMKQAGIVPIAIGAKNADAAELQQIVSNPDSVLKLEDFKELETIQHVLLFKVRAVSVVDEPIPPTEVVRREMSERDIVFLIDGSDNVGSTNLPFVKDFITRIVRNLAIGSDQVRVGLAQYSDDTEAEFYLNTYSSEAELLSHIRTLRLRGGTTANTGSALDFASKYFFTSSAGSRIKENIPQFLVLITIGRSDDDVEASSDALKRAAVMTFAVGVKHTDPVQLEEMAIDPSLIFNVNDFQSLPDLLDEMIIPLTTLAVPTIIIEEPTRKPEEEPIPTIEVRKRDIVFLIDGSPGMGRSFLQVREFLNNIIQELDIGPDRDQVAVVQYSSNPRLEFGLNTHSTLDAVLNTIKRMRLKTGRPLNTGAALDYVTRNVFSPSTGSRGDAGASQILVLITAGKSRDDVGQAADTMKQAGIVPIAIGAKDADTAELQKIVYEPNFILKPKDFKELETIQQGLLSMFGVVPVVEEPIPPIEEKPIPPIDEKPIPPIDEKPIPPIDEKPIPPIDEKPIPPIDEKPIPPIDEKPIPPIDEKPIAPPHEEPILPTEEEPIPPTEVVPQDVNRRDILFLIDGSVYVGNVNFIHIREFITRLIETLDIGSDRVQVAVVQFSDDVKTEFYLNSYSSKANLLPHVKGLNAKGGRIVNTGAALDYVLKNHFTKSAGSRKEQGVPQILMLITGARSRDDIKPSADALKRAALHTLTVGARRADPTQLKEISSDPNLAFNVKEFRSLSDIENQVVTSLSASVMVNPLPTTTVPPVTTTEVVAQEVRRRDIVFLIDGSVYVGNINFIHIREFITRLIETLDIGSDRVQVAVVQYSDDMKTEFYLNSYSSKANLLSHVKGLKMKGGRIVNTGAALDYVLKNHFTKSAGSRKEQGVPQILMLFTGGRSRDDIQLLADTLKRAAVHTLTVGARRADPTQLKEISSDPNLAFNLREFHLLSDIQNQVLTHLSTVPDLPQSTEKPMVTINEVIPKLVSKRDIVFLIDGSDYVGNADFPFVRDFLSSFIENLDFGSDRVRIGLVQFSDYAETEFYLNTYSSEDEILRHVEGIRLRGGAPLNIGAALDYVYRNHFTRSSGSRKEEGVPQSLVLITAGRSRDYIKQSVDALKRADVTMFAVGTSNADSEQLREIASEPSLLLNVNEFRSLPHVQEQLMISMTSPPEPGESTDHPRVPVNPGNVSKQDIVFLIDGSDYVGNADFPFVRDFLSSIIENFDIGSDRVQIGLVQFSNYAESEFYLNTYSSEDEILRHVEGIRLRGGTPLNTGAALDYVYRNHFTRSSGSRKEDGVPQLLVLITAGRSRDYIKQSVDALKRADVTVFAVGTRNADSAQLREVASEPSLLLSVNEFRSLPHVQEQLMISMTSPPEPGESTDRPSVPVNPGVPDGGSRRDIVFLIDGSDNVGNRNVPFVRDFLTSIIQNLDIDSDRVQVGLVQYSNFAETEFYLNTYSSEDEILSHVEGLRLRGRNTLNTGAALEYVLRNHFTRSSGSRKEEGVPQLLVLITAGRSSDDINLPADALKQAAVITFAVGAKDSDPAQLKEIAIDPNSVFSIQEFSSLPHIQEQLMTPLSTLAASRVPAERPTVPVKQVVSEEVMKRDIVFLVDASDNVGNTHFAVVRDFLTSIIDNLDVGHDKVQVGLILYSTYADTEFYLNTYLSKADILTHVRRLRLKGGTRRNTGAAMDHAYRYHFINSAGSRKKNGVAQFLVLITGGASSDDVSRAAAALKRAAIMSFAVGVKNADLAELNDIAIDPSLVFRVSESRALLNIQGEVTTLLSTLPAPRVIPEEPTAVVEPVIPDGGSKRDIVFLVDTSDNVGRENFLSVRDFLSSIMENLDIGSDRVRVGLVQYSSYAETEFYLNTYSSEDEVLTHVKGLRLRGGRSINTGAALDSVLRYHFTQHGGSRKDEGVPQVLVLITSGSSGDDVKTPADKMKQDAMITFVIGAKNANPAQIKEIASDPGLVFNVQEFHSLPDIKEQVTSSLLTLAAPPVTHDKSKVIAGRVTDTIPEVTSEAEIKRDIVFLIDESDNIGNSNAPHVHDFITRLIENLDIGSDRVRVGLVLYSDAPETKFYLNTYSRKDELLSLLRPLRFKGGMTANTGKALDFVFRYHFTQSSGSRKDEGVPQFLLLITGGRSGDDIKASADTLKRAAIMTFAIGARNTDTAQLKEIAFEPSLVFNLRDFYSLSDIQEKVLPQIQRLRVPQIIIDEPKVDIREPTVAPTEVPAVRKRDIVFLIAGSSEMGRSFLQVRDFLKKIIQELDIGPDRDQVAVVQYSSDPKLEFGFNAHLTRDAVSDAIKKLRLKPGRPLNTGAALDYVTRNVFSPSAGSRGDAGASQILVLITAGKSRDNVGQAADTMKQAGIVPIAIGAKDADATELQQLVSNPESVLKLGDFHELTTIQQELLSKVRAVSVIEEPTVPTEVVRREMSERDIVFLIDGSDNVGNTNLPFVKDFITRIVQNLAIGSDQVRVGLAQYSDDTEAEFYLNTYSSEAELLSHIRTLRLRGGTTANTGSALDFASKYFFTSSAGSRIKENIPQFLVLVTIGRSDDDVDAPSDALKRAAVMTFAVGVKHTDPAQLEEMAIDPSLIFSVNDFQSLPDLLDEMIIPLTTLAVPTVIEEPISIEEQVITTEAPAARQRDIVFLIDGTLGMGKAFPLVRAFLAKVIQELDIGPDKDQVAMVQYSHDTKTEFGLNTYASKDEVLAAAAQVRRKTGRVLNTGAALNYVTRNIFVASAGSRQDMGATQILVLITAGKSRDDVGQAAHAVKQAGIVPVVIGAKAVHPAELQQLVYSPDFIFIRKTFQTIPQILQQLTSILKSVSLESLDDQPQ